MADDNKKVKVEKGTTQGGTRYGRVSVGDKAIGYGSDDTSSRAYYNNYDTGRSAWAGKANYDGRNYYHVGADLPNGSPVDYREYNTPIGKFDMGQADSDLGAYIGYESPVRRGITNLPDGTVVNDMNYSTPNGYAYANRENYPDGNVGFTMGYERNGVNAPETWNERETPLGTIGYGNNGSGYSAFYEPNPGIQNAYAKLVSLLGGR